MSRLTKSQKYFLLFFIILCFSTIIIIKKLVNDSFDKVTEYNRILAEGYIRNQERLRNVEKVCSKYNLGVYRNSSLKPTFKEPPIPQYEVFYYDLKHKLTWCPIYKAGSSTWLYNFALLGGTTEKALRRITKQLNDFVRQMFPILDGPLAKIALENTVKFLVVRHPFERILSAYRDKLENSAVRQEDGTYHFYQSFGRIIVKKYRLGGNKTNIRHILRPNQYIWNEINEPIGVEPSFKEFVRYLIDLDLNTRADDHWIPYYLFCTPCMVKYDIIGKLETMHEDQILTIFTAGLRHKITPKWRHKTSPFENQNYNQVSQVAQVYFSQLSKTDVEKLYRKYKLDFELFQYEAQNYFKYASLW